MWNNWISQTRDLEMSTKSATYHSNQDDDEDTYADDNHDFFLQKKK